MASPEDLESLAKELGFVLRAGGSHRRLRSCGQHSQLYAGRDATGRRDRGRRTVARGQGDKWRRDPGLESRALESGMCLRGPQRRRL